MAKLLEIKECLKKIYAKYEGYITPAVKFLLAFILLMTLNAKTGYMEKIDHVSVVLIVALFCSFMPMPTIALMAGLFLLLHYYALSIECAFIVLVLLLVMYLLFIRLVPKETLLVVLTPLLFAMKIPYVIPVAAGLLGGPLSIVSVSCGVIISFLVEYTGANITTLTSMTGEGMIGKCRFMLDGIVGNNAMLIVLIAFAVTLLVVYFVRRTSMNYSWYIAIVAGILTDVMILMLGDLFFDLDYSVIGMIFGSLVSAAVCLVIQFFTFNVDYSRTEKVQFEDDEYYYYVKAVPKICVAASDKKVKKISSGREGAVPGNMRRSAAPHGTDSGRRTTVIKTAHGVTRTTSERTTRQTKE